MKQKPDYILIKEWCISNFGKLPTGNPGYGKMFVGGELWDDLLNMLKESGYNHLVNDTEYTGDELLELLYNNNVEIWYGGEDE
jgi:hypothetical protein